MDWSKGQVATCRSANTAVAEDRLTVPTKIENFIGLSAVHSACRLSDDDIKAQCCWRGATIQIEQEWPVNEARKRR